MKAYRKDMYRRLHDDIKQLPLPRIVQRRVVPPLDAKNDLEHVRDEDITPPVLVRDVQPVPDVGQVQLLLDHPRARAHVVRHGFGRVLAGVDEGVQGGVSEGVGGVGEREERGAVFLHVFEREQCETGDGV